MTDGPRKRTSRIYSEKEYKQGDAVWAAAFAVAFDRLYAGRSSHPSSYEIAVDSENCANLAQSAYHRLGDVRHERGDDAD